MIHTTYEPQIRARLGTATHFCEVVVLKLKGGTHATPPLIRTKHAFFMDRNQRGHILPFRVSSLDPSSWETLASILGAMLRDAYEVLLLRQSFIDQASRESLIRAWITESARGS